MAAEPPKEPTTDQEEDYDGEGDESDVYEMEGEEAEGDVYRPEEDEDEEDEDEDEDEDGVGEGEPENMTALLLGKKNGTTRTVEEDEEESDGEYHDDGEGTAEDPIFPVAGSKRGVDELSEGDVGDEEDDEVTAAKKTKV